MRPCSVCRAQALCSPGSWDPLVPLALRGHLSPLPSPCPRLLPPFPCLCSCRSPSPPAWLLPATTGGKTVDTWRWGAAVKGREGSWGDGAAAHLPGGPGQVPSPLLMKLFTRAVERHCPSSGTSSMGQRDAVPATGNGSVGEGPGEPPRELLIGLQGWRGQDVPAHAAAHGVGYRVSTTWVPVPLVSPRWPAPLPTQLAGPRGHTPTSGGRLGLPGGPGARASGRPGCC